MTEGGVAVPCDQSKSGSPTQYRRVVWTKNSEAVAESPPTTVNVVSGLATDWFAASPLMLTVYSPPASSGNV